MGILISRHSVSSHMGQLRLGMAVLLWFVVMTLFSCAADGAGEIYWTDEVTDPQGDVRDSLGNVATGRGEIDILSVFVTEAGADLSVTMKLAEPYTPAAEYTIDLLADGVAVYRLTWRRVFAVEGPSGAVITVSGQVSRDGAELSWVMAKSTLAVATALRIGGAEARVSVPGGLVYVDAAEGAPPHDGDGPLPRSISVKVVYGQLNLRNATVRVVYEGENASAVRAMLDLDTDGAVEPAEANAYATTVRDRIARDSRLPSSTLDGRMATRVSYGFDLTGAQGSVTGATPVQFTMVQVLEFPSPETRGSHVCVFETAIGGDEPWENKLFGDDPWGDECIGGDEPWENVFFGALVPWGDECIGGDEPWENKVDVTFSLEAPDGWQFVTEGWPPGLVAHLNSQGDGLEMDPAASASSYASTMGRLNMLVFEETSRDVGEGFMPAWVVLTVFATGRIAGLLMVRRRRVTPS